MKKRVLVLFILVFVMAVGALFADIEFWNGTGQIGNNVGQWKGKLDNGMDPNYISGKWEFNASVYGKFKGCVQVTGIGSPRYGSGYIHDSNNNIVGTWTGVFPPIGIDAQAYGTFTISSTSDQGAWIGSMY